MRSITLTCVTNRQFGIPTDGPNASQRDQWLVGLVNSAPYVCRLYTPLPRWLKRPSLALLRLHWMLAHRAAQQMAGSPRCHFRGSFLLFRDLHLAGRH